jgi:phosphoesterase RecJ-like protein
VKVPEEVVEVLLKKDRFVVLSHINPEGDALGSSIALAVALKQLGKDVEVFNKDGIPSIYRFLPEARIVKKFNELTCESDSVVIIVDCNNPERVGIKEDINCNLSLVIDHHETEDDFGDVRWIEPSSPATGVMIYHLLMSLNVRITEAIATNLYTAISIDTGSFRYSNTTAETLLIGADLIRQGANPAYIAERLFESWSKNRFMLLIETLNTLEIKRIQNKDASLTVAITTITTDMFKRTETDSSDTENFSNFPRMIEDVQISAMFRETEKNKWKASLRSKGDVNVARIASVFGGGGHRNAAGFFVEGNIEEIKKSFVEEISDILVKDGWRDKHL